MSGAGLARAPAIVVVGGGISGLAAAWELTHPSAGEASCRVTLVDGAPALGGKIATEPFAGIDLDTGPDSFLARVPAATRLACEAGLGDDLVAPATGQAWIWAARRLPGGERLRGGEQLRALPPGLVLGVPTDLGALARSRVLSPQAAARAALDLVLPGEPLDPAADIAVGELVRRRMGRSVQLDLVDPMIGGINAGHTDTLSAAVAAPQLLAAARSSTSLVRGLRTAAAGRAPGVPVGRQVGDPAGPGAGVPGAGVPGVGGSVGGVTGRPREAGGGMAVGAPETAAPVFLTVRGGLSRLVEALAHGIASVAGTEMVVGDAVTTISRDDQRFTVRLASGRSLPADAVVVACSVPTAAALIQALSPTAAAGLRAIGTASVALTTLSYPAKALPRPLMGSGFLVPRAKGRLLTACSWVGQKWPHLGVNGRVVIRASAGRVDDVRALTMDDDDLVDALHHELVSAMGLQERPVEARVHRWPDAFPQFGVGHLDRVDAIERSLEVDAPGVTVAGAALRGVGLATCVTGGRAAAIRAREHAASALAAADISTSAPGRAGHNHAGA